MHIRLQGTCKWHSIAAAKHELGAAYQITIICNLKTLASNFHYKGTFLNVNLCTNNSKSCWKPRMEGRRNSCRRAEGRWKEIINPQCVPVNRLRDQSRVSPTVDSCPLGCHRRSWHGSLTEEEWSMVSSFAAKGCHLIAARPEPGYEEGWVTWVNVARKESKMRAAAQKWNPDFRDDATLSKHP